MLWLLLLLLLLLLCLKLSGILLNPLSRHVRQIASSNASKDHWYHVRWNTALHGFSQHRLLNLALFEPEAFLSRPFLLLSPPVFLSFSYEPVLHAVFRTLTLP
jgi:hypothetical protein